MTGEDDDGRDLIRHPNLLTQRQPRRPRQLTIQNVEAELLFTYQGMSGGYIWHTDGFKGVKAERGRQQLADIRIILDTEDSKGG